MRCGWFLPTIELISVSLVSAVAICALRPWIAPLPMMSGEVSLPVLRCRVWVSTRSASADASCDRSCPYLEFSTSMRSSLTMPLDCWNFESLACDVSRAARKDFVWSSRNVADCRAGATRSSTETSM